MKVIPIARLFCFEGRATGIPCLAVHFSEKHGKEIELDTLITDILKFSKLNIVEIKGKLSEYSEIKTLIDGLVAKGKQIIFITPATEDIGPIRPLPKVKIILTMSPPTSKKSTVNLSNLSLLKEDDDIKINIKNLKDYEDAKVFLKSKIITRPTVLFSINKYEKSIEMVEKYLIDCDTFFFKSRISKAISL